MTTSGFAVDQRLVDSLAHHMATDGLAAGADFRLSKPSDWDDWLSRIRRYADFYGLWFRIDPSSEVMPRQREEPQRPLCLETDGREGKLAELSAYSVNNQMYQSERKGLVRVFEFVVQHISTELYHAVVPAVVDGHPWTLLRKLHDRLAPTPLERQAQVLATYDELRKTPRKDALLAWCDEWEKMVVRAEECSLFDRHCRLLMAEFLTAVRPYYEDYAVGGLRAVSTPDIVSTLALHDLVNGVRTSERNGGAKIEEQGIDQDADASAQTLRDPEKSIDEIKAELRAEFEEFKQELTTHTERKVDKVTTNSMIMLQEMLGHSIGVATQTFMGATRGEFCDALVATKAKLNTALENQRREIDENSRRELDDLERRLKEQATKVIGDQNENQTANANLIRKVEEELKAEIANQRREHDAKFDDQCREIQELKKALEDKATTEKGAKKKTTRSTSKPTVCSPVSSGKLVYRKGKLHWVPPPCPCGEVHYYSRCLYINKALRPPGWVPNEEIVQRVQTHGTDPANDNKMRRSLQTWKKCKKRMTERAEAAEAAEAEGSAYAESVSDGVPLWPKEALTERVAGEGDVQVMWMEFGG